MKFNKSKSNQIHLKQIIKEAVNNLNTCFQSRIIDLSNDLMEGKITDEQLSRILQKGITCPNSVLGPQTIYIKDNLVLLEQMLNIKEVNQKFKKQLE